MLYMSVVVLDNMNKVQICCDDLMISKTFKVNKMMIDACFKMTLVMKCENIYCIFSDEFLTTNFLVSPKLHNTKLVFDHYRLDLNFQKLCLHLYA